MTFRINCSNAQVTVCNFKTSMIMSMVILNLLRRNSLSALNRSLLSSMTAIFPGIFLALILVSDGTVLLTYRTLGQILTDDRVI